MARADHGCCRAGRVSPLIALAATAIKVEGLLTPMLEDRSSFVRTASPVGVSSAC